MNIESTKVFQSLSIWNRSWQTFLLKGQIINVFGFVSHAVYCCDSALTLQYREAAIDGIDTPGHSCVPTKLLYRNRPWVRPVGHSLPAPDWGGEEREVRNKCILFVTAKNTSPFVLSMRVRVSHENRQSLTSLVTVTEQIPFREFILSLSIEAKISEI